MANFDLIGKVELDTSQAKQQLHDLGEGTPSLIESSQTPPLTNYTNSIGEVSQSLIQTKDVLREVIEQFKIFSKLLEENNERRGIMGGGGTPDDMQAQPSWAKVNRGKVGSMLFNAGVGVSSAIASGSITAQMHEMDADYLGAKASGWSTAGGVLSTTGATLGAIAPFLGPASGAMIALSLGLSAFGSMANVRSQKYALENKEFQRALEIGERTDSLSVLYGTGDEDPKQRYGKVSNMEIRYRNAYKIEQDLTKAIKDNFLNLTSEEASQIAISLGSQGINDAGTAVKMITQAGITAKNTNADINSIITFMGQIGRFSNENGINKDGINEIQKIEKYAEISGLDKGQFQEFLDGISQVMQDGISKGFVRSTDDIAANLTLLSKMSENNPMWEGSYGVQNYLKMTNGLASSTSLSNTASLIAYRTMANSMGGESYVDVMAALEEGDLDESYLKNLHKNFKKTFSGHRESVVEEYRKLFGMNYSQAIDFYDMQENLLNGKTSASEIQEKLDTSKTVTDSTFESYTHKRMDNINQELKNIGSHVSNIESGIKGLETYTVQDVPTEVPEINSDYNPKLNSYYNITDSQYDRFTFGGGHLYFGINGETNTEELLKSLYIKHTGGKIPKNFENIKLDPNFLDDISSDGILDYDEFKLANTVLITALKSLKEALDKNTDATANQEVVVE